MKKHGSYVMEDWLHFTETFSLYLLHGNLLGPKQRRMWGLLRSATIFCFRASELIALPECAPFRVGRHYSSNIGYTIEPMPSCRLRPVLPSSLQTCHAVDPECHNNPFTPAAIDKFVRDLGDYRSMVQKVSHSGRTCVLPRAVHFVSGS